MAKRLKRINAGPLEKIAIYTCPGKHEKGRARAEKKKITSAAVARMNEQYAYQKLEMLLAANFKRGDLVITYTFSDEFLPATREDAEKLMKKHIRQLRAARGIEGRNDSLKYLHTYEDKHGDGRKHFHAVMNSTGQDYDEIQSLWPYGKVDIQSLIPDGKDKNYASLARYLTKESREYEKPKHKKRWVQSKNLIQPEEDTMDLEDYMDLTVPEGAILLDEDQSKNEFGSWHYIKVYYPAREEPPTVRRPRSRGSS